MFIYNVVVVHAMAIGRCISLSQQSYLEIFILHYDRRLEWLSACGTH